MPPRRALLVAVLAALSPAPVLATTLPGAVDTGLASFITPAQASSVDAAGLALSAADKNIYNDWFHAQIGDKNDFAETIPLPDGTRILMFSIGWGDGIYPVANLKDANGATVAIYADFMGKDTDGNWLLPPECSKIGQ